MSYRFWLILSLCLMALAVVSARPLAQIIIPDALTTAMRHYAGVNSINCGVVPIGWSFEAANRCVDAAYQAKQAFTVRYNLQGIDSQFSEGLASNECGEIHGYGYDKYVMDENPTDEHVSEQHCRTIRIILDVYGKRRGCEP